MQKNPFRFRICDIWRIAVTETVPIEYTDIETVDMAVINFFRDETKKGARQNYIAMHL